MRVHLMAALLFGAVATTGSAFPAPAKSLHCGDTITTDTVLTKNLVCAGTALNLSTTGDHMVTIDLNGHRLKGNGTGTGISVTWNYQAYPQLGSLTVTNGTITGFAAAMIGGSGRDFVLNTLTLTDLRLVANNAWLPPSIRREVLVKNSSIIDSGFGGAYNSSGSLTAQNSLFLRSGINSEDESFNYLYNNTFIEAGFRASAESDVIAINNIFRDCDTALTVNGTWSQAPTRVEDNKFIHCRIGVDLPQMSGPVSVQRNLFSKNTQAGMTFSVLAPHQVDIADNTFAGNAGDGLTGSGEDPNTALPATVVRVTGNLAVRNAGHGINVINVTDGGANRARGNGSSPECLGVVCAKP